MAKRHSKTPAGESSERMIKKFLKQVKKFRLSNNETTLYQKVRTKRLAKQRRQRWIRKMPKEGSGEIRMSNYYTYKASGPETRLLLSQQLCQGSHGFFPATELLHLTKAFTFQSASAANLAVFSTFNSRESSVGQLCHCSCEIKCRSSFLTELAITNYAVDRNRRGICRRLRRGLIPRTRQKQAPTGCFFISMGDLRKNKKNNPRTCIKGRIPKQKKCLYFHKDTRKRP